MGFQYEAAVAMFAWLTGEKWYSVWAAAGSATAAASNRQSKGFIVSPRQAGVPALILCACPVFDSAGGCRGTASQARSSPYS